MGTQAIDEVRQTVAEVFSLDAEQITATSSPDTVSAWDSLGHLSLILALEQRFGVAFDPDEMPKLTSVQALADAISAKKG